MNNYLIKTARTSFPIEAEDSDMASMKADIYAKERNIIACRASMVLMQEGSENLLGEFDLAGVTIPKTWSEIKLLNKNLRATAKANAKENWEYPCLKHRGTFLLVLNDKEEQLVGAGDGWTFPATKSEWERDIKQIADRYPSASTIISLVGIDAANTVQELLHGECEPWAGLASAPVFLFGEQ